MRPRLDADHDRGMTAEPLRISIEIDRDPGGLRGRVQELEFVGWLGLLSALGDAIDRLPADDGPASQPLA
jgi:hypothetical protein